MEAPRVIIKAAPGIDTKEVVKQAEAFELSGYLFQTSGSSGAPKWVHITQESLELAAKQSSAQLGSEGGRWIAALPDYHVGGYMVHMRAGSEHVIHLKGRWDVAEFYSLCHSAEYSALVPAQIVDLVAYGKTCPEGVRAILVGGGYLDDSIYSSACRLGWPLMRSYGMTETCASVALELDRGSNWMTLQPEWDARLEDDGTLLLKGDALFSGYFRQNGSMWRYEKTPEWFRTSDRFLLKGRSLRFLNRADRTVKILGELVSLPHVEQQLRKVSKKCIVLAMPDERKGSRLLAMGTDRQALLKAIAQWNESALGYARILNYCCVVDIPITELGKVDMTMAHELASRCEEVVI